MTVGALNLNMEPTLRKEPLYDLRPTKKWALGTPGIPEVREHALN